MLTLTCHNSNETMSDETEDSLVTLAQQHAEGHGHTPPPTREHVLTRIRRQNPRD